MTPLESETCALADSYVGERETDGPNDSPFIRRCLAHVSCRPPAQYCAAFVSLTVYDAGMRVPVLPRFKRSAGALRLLDLNPSLIISRAVAVERLRQGRPCVFVVNHGGGRGHAGFARGIVDADHFWSVEANTGPGPAAPASDRNGQGTYRRSDRRIDTVAGWLAVG